MVRYIFFLFALLLIGCQTDLSSNNELVKGNSDLKISDGVLDLSQFSQEQQKVERDRLLNDEGTKSREGGFRRNKGKNWGQSVNLAVFARSVSKISEKIYFRNFFGAAAQL